MAAALDAGVVGRPEHGVALGEDGRVGPDVDGVGADDGWLHGRAVGAGQRRRGRRRTRRRGGRRSRRGRRSATAGRRRRRSARRRRSGAPCSATNGCPPWVPVTTVTWRFCASGRTSDSNTSMPRRASARASWSKATLMASALARHGDVAGADELRVRLGDDRHPDDRRSPQPRAPPCWARNGIIPPPWEWPHQPTRLVSMRGVASTAATMPASTTRLLSSSVARLAVVDVVGRVHDDVADADEVLDQGDVRDRVGLAEAVGDEHRRPARRRRIGRR